MSKTPPSAANAAPRTATITLDTPLQRGEQTIETLTLRKPVAGELRGIALADLLRLDIGALQAVLPRITSPTLTPHDVGQLELPDLAAVGSEIVGFFMTRKEREALSPAT